MPRRRGAAPDAAGGRSVAADAGGARRLVVAGAIKTEHLAIAADTGLVKKAQAMGRTDTAQLLRQNLQQEQNMLLQLETISGQMTQRLASLAGASAS